MIKQKYNWHCYTVIILKVVFFQAAKLVVLVKFSLLIEKIPKIFQVRLMSLKKINVALDIQLKRKK